MTLEELLLSTYAWLEARALWILVASLVVPGLGMVGAWVGRGGKTERDGRFLANLTLAFGFILFALEILGLGIAQWGFDQGLLDANLLLLLAPPLALATSLLGIRLIFPLSELGSAQTARDLTLFVGALFGVFWLFSKFRGWGIVFFGGLFQLLAIGVLVVLMIRTLYGRLR